MTVHKVTDMRGNPIMQVLTDENDVVLEVTRDVATAVKEILSSPRYDGSWRVQCLIHAGGAYEHWTEEEGDTIEDGVSVGSPVKKGGEFVIAKFDTDKQLVFGWAYVSHDADGNVVVDKSGEFIDDYGELEEAAYLFVEKSRVGGDSHARITSEIGTDDSAKKVGTMVESMVFTPEKIAKMGLPPGVLPTGWWVGFKVEDPEVWKAVKRGERPAFSIHGSGRREEVTE
jgi:hypothetical protein